MMTRQKSNVTHLIFTHVLDVYGADKLHNLKNLIDAEIDEIYQRPTLDATILLNKLFRHKLMLHENTTEARTWLEDTVDELVYAESFNEVIVPKLIELGIV